MMNYLNVPGAQVTKAEREFIKEQARQIAAKFPQGNMVNIGIMWGCSLWCIRAGAPHTELYGIDMAPENWEIKGQQELDFTLIKGDSHELHKTFDKPIHLLFIDGDHTYASVKADIEGWTPKVVPGGVVIFHDYAPTAHNLKQFPEIDGVRRAVNEWMSDKTAQDWAELPAPDSIRSFQCLK